MASEVIKLNLIPKGDMPVFHCSQFDNGRLINIELYRGEDAYTIPEGCTAELHCRKVDGNIVTIGSPVVDENTIKFTSTTQLTACNGKNLCEVAILGADDYRIGTLNFWLEVEIDPLKGGINSTSEIHDLYDQIEDITAEVIGDNYYDKTEVDTLLDDKADKSNTYTKTQVDTLLTSKADKSNVYTKSETNTLLSAKADADNVYTKAQVETKLAAKADAASVYTKDETDTLLDAKANANAVYTKVEVDAMVDDIEDAIDLKADAATTYTKTEVDSALALKANAADVYTKAQTYSQAQVDALIDNIFPTLTASGAIATFTTALAKPLVSVTTAEGATTVTACGVNLLKLKNGVYNVRGVDVTVSNGTITANGTATDGGGRFVELSEYFTLKAGTYYIKSFYNDTGLTPYLQTSASSPAINSGDNRSFTISEDAEVYLGVNVVNGKTYEGELITPMLIIGSTAPTEYILYNGQTVPVADATTLITQSGVNNVYANAGDITVQYKYMSM